VKSSLTSETRQAEIKDKAENPFLRPPYWSPGYVPEPINPDASKADLRHRLKACITQMHTFCYDKEVTLRPGEIFWPRKAWLCELSECIWRLSSLHRRGRNDLWSRVVAIDNRYPALKLSSKIEKLVDRAAKLCYEPTASAIQRQAIAGNQAAHDRFAAVQRCHDGRSKISSENWEPYREILRPLPAESCADKVEQLVADWWRNDLSPDKPWNDLASWLSTIGNACLVAKLVGPDSPYFFYATLSECESRRRRRTLATKRQKKYRRRMNDPILRALKRLLGTPSSDSGDKAEK
jgi:hypothetical protein